MTVREIDSRTAEADRAYYAWVQRGADPATVAAMLPALVSSNAGLRQRAESWLSDRGLVGHDLSDEGLRHSRAVTQAAKEFVSREMESGSFAGERAFQPGTRYAAPEADVHEALDERSLRIGYPEAQGNVRRLALSEAEAKLPAGYWLDDEGNVFDRAGQMTGETVRLPEARKVVVTNGMVQSSPRPDTDQTAPAFYKTAPDGDWEDGPNRPFFA